MTMNQMVRHNHSASGNLGSMAGPELLYTPMTTRTVMMFPMTTRMIFLDLVPSRFTLHLICSENLTPYSGVLMRCLELHQ